MQRRWMADWREAKLRLIARGHRPLWATPRMIEEAYKHYPDGLPSAALNTP
jgi:flavorubredoxin